MNLPYLLVPHELSDEAAAHVAELLNDLAVEAVTARSAILLPAVATRADPHLTLTPGAQKQSGIVHRSPPTRRAGRSDFTRQYWTRSRMQVRLWAQPRT